MIGSKVPTIIITCKRSRQYSKGVRFAAAGLVIFLIAFVGLGLFLSSLSLRSFRPSKAAIYENEFRPLIEFRPLMTPSARSTPSESNHFYSATKTLSAGHSDSKPNFVVLLTCSDGFFQMWQNWLAFFVKLKIPNLPVHLFAEDNITFKKCLRQMKGMKNKKKRKSKSLHNGDSSYDVDLSCLAWETVFSEPTKKRIPAWGYRKTGYVKMMSHRPFIIQKELENGYDVIFSDVDVVWLKSPLPYFENDFDATSIKNSNDGKGGSPSGNATEEISIWAQLDPPERGKSNDNFCPGFMVYRSTPETIRFAQKWGYMISHGEKLKRNQGPFNKLIRHPEKYGVSKIETKSLPMELFVTGTLYFENMTDAQRKEVVVIHNNGISGYDKKVARFKNFSLWILDQ